MPKFSSLADDSFSGEKKKTEMVKLRPPAHISADVTLTQSVRRRPLQRRGASPNGINIHATISDCIAVPSESTRAVVFPAC